MRQLPALVLMACLISSCASDENLNVPLPYSISEALALGDYKERLKDIRLYFGNQSHPAVEKSFGDRSTAQRSNAVGQQSKDSCARAFASALLRLRSVALASGGNALIGIKSNYGNLEVSSEGSYQCASGTFMSGVALKGTIVKLRN